MSDSKLGAQARGQRNLVPEVVDEAPDGTELGWVVWVANPSSGGGGTVDQGKKGSSGESWYVQDGSGLLATAAKQDAGNASLAAIDSKLGSPLAVTGPLTDTQLRAAAVPVSATSLPLPSGAATESTLLSVLGQVDAKTSTLATAALQTTGNSSLSSIDTKLSSQATAANQTTGNSTLTSILGQLDSKTSTLATESTLSATKTLLGAGLPAALVGGRLDVNIGAGTVTVTPSGTQDVNLTKVGGSAVALGQAANAASLPVTLSSTQTGTAGTPASQVLSVQGIASMTPIQVSQATAANLNATVAQGAGSGSTATFWYTRGTDGTNATTVKAASTAPVAADTALVVAVSPNGGQATASNQTSGGQKTQIVNASGTTVGAGSGILGPGAVALAVSDNTQQTFVVSAQGVLTGNGKSMISIENGGGSGKVLRLVRAKIFNVTPGTVAGVDIQLDALKFTTSSGGTILTPQSYDTNNTLSGSITCRTNATISGEATNAIDSWYFNGDELATGASTTASNGSLTGQILLPYGGLSQQVPTIRSGEGLHIKCQTNTTVTNFSLFLVFTQE